MEKYIPLDAVLAEIEKRIRACGNCYILDELTSLHRTFDSLEVKEVDLEKAISDYIYTHEGRKRLALELNWKCCNLTLKGGNEIIKFAKHFFELGLKSKSSYVGTPSIDDTLKEMGVDPDSKSAKSFKEFYYMALEKFKAQKGEKV